MENHEGRATQPIDAIDIANFLGCAGGVVIGIEPLNKGSN
jgi:hypothetical protein